MRTVLVIGATGRTGRHVVDGLLDEGAHVRALARHPPTAGLPARVERFEGDLGVADTVAAAADGADAAFLLWPAFSADGARAVIDALGANVGHVVYLSAARLQDGDPAAPMDGVWSEIERMIAAAAVTHTFVRAGGFAANTLQWADQIRVGDSVRMPFADAARSLVDERDIAAVAVRALVDPALAGRAIEVTGPAVLTQREQIELIGRAIGRRLEVHELSPDEARAQQHGEAFAEASLAHWATLVDRPERTRDGVEQITGRPARTFADWAAFHADDFRRATA
jgi:uncharacterized protein YbjT (DUF2867 family)